MSGSDLDVAIIGSGPSGIAAATALREAGVKNIVVYERETDIGGIPRHTHHPSFGLLVFKRPMSGPKFIEALVRRCPAVRFETNTTITAIRTGGELDIATPSGIQKVRARHIVLATGAREAPRHARLVSGLRPIGVTTTGALQQFIYSAKIRPFNRPVIVGTELVGFSALWTLRSAGIKAAAMVEGNSRITAYRPAALAARVLGVPIYRNATISGIGGIARLNHIVIECPKTGSLKIDCDGLVFSGGFVGENALARASHLALNSDTQLPQVDQNWLSSDPAISVIGNATHPADMGDQCYHEGLAAGKYIAKLLAGGANPYRRIIEISHGDGIKMSAPSIIRANGKFSASFDISFHVTKPYSGPVEVTYSNRSLYKKSHRCMPARRITLRGIILTADASGADTVIKISLEN